MKAAIQFSWTAIVFALVSDCFSHSVGASEPDNFTDRPIDPKSWSDHAAENQIDQKTNELLESVIRNVKNCDLKDLHLGVKDALAGGEIGKLEAWTIREPTLTKVTVPIEKSIYGDAGLMTGSFGIFLMGIVPSFMIDGHYIGSDKFGHFFDQGYDYYEAIYVHHISPIEVIKTLGLKDEQGRNGMDTNGITSYADLAANFSGYLFWREVAGGDNPYFACENGKFKRTARKFKWADYANDAWDEALNCSVYSESVSDGVGQALKKLHMSCPIQPNACQKIMELPCGFTFTSPECRPYVTIKETPDTLCEKILKADEFESQSCLYESGISRGPTVKTALDWIDGAETAAGLRTRQFLKWRYRLLGEESGQSGEWLSGVHQ